MSIFRIYGCISSATRYRLPAIGLALALFIATSLWVPDVHVAHGRYYKADWMTAGLQPRALIGTLAHALQLSPHGYVILLQLFKFGWLVLLCVPLMHWIRDRYIALLLCIMFAFNSMIYIANAMHVFVDIAADFWLIAAAALILKRPAQPCRQTVLSLLGAALLLCLTVLTHEKFAFECSVLALWALLRYRALGWLVALPWLSFTGLYLWLVRHRVTSGASPAGYADILASGPWQLMQHDFVNAYGIFTAAGMLWIVYAALAYGILRRLPRAERWRYGAFIAYGVLANLAPLLVAGDTQRMVGGVWLALYILLIDQAEVVNAYAQSSKTYAALSLLCALHLLIPPVFIYGQAAKPLNCYAEQTLPFIIYRGHRDMWLPQFLPDPAACRQK